MFDHIPKREDSTSTESGNLQGSSIPHLSRPRVHGKFLFVGDHKLYLHGVTYGTFGLSDGAEYDSNKVHSDFALMARNGVNTIRVYTVPPLWLLDAARKNGLYVMVGLPWEQHIDFLNDAKITRSIELRVRENVRVCAKHPAVLCYAVGNEIPAPVVRWLGAERVEAFLHRLYKIVKSEDPDALVTYVNYPSTEYLDLSFADFACFNVYLEEQQEYEAYLARLQNLAGDRPLVMAEIGLDSRRNGLEAQAKTLEWQLRTTFESGCAGVYVFSWTDEWHRGGNEIEDWDFGLTTRGRAPKPALDMVRKVFSQVPFAASTVFAPVSVVVCSYNGASTIRDCLEGLTRLDYPNYEVIVVNDGSTDNTSEIAKEYPFKLISTPNMGLSSARNTGLYAAAGEIVAYTDDDAHPDPHWLQYLAATFAKTDHVGVGGPNIAPLGDGEIAECVANSPGGPIHVLVNDTEAEHIPGCNMAFRREALLAIGGFDPLYRTAGDDVDVCWRMHENGWTLGFSPAAMVWHHRRNSIRDYWRQQQGYGKAEALLERKWPGKYNAAGHLTWTGRLYGKGLTEALRLRRGLIYQGVWGSAPFQAVYRPATGLIASLPLMPEWYIVIFILAILVFMGSLWTPLFWFTPLLVAAVIAPLMQAVFSGCKAQFIDAPISRAKDVKLRSITALLHILQPLARLKGRLQHGLNPWRRPGKNFFILPVPRSLTFWVGVWSDPAKRLADIETAVQSVGAVVRRNGEFDDRWDLYIRGGMFGGTRLYSLVEEHGQGSQVVRFRIRSKGSLFFLAAVTILGVLSLLALFDGQIAVAATTGAFVLGILARGVMEAGNTAATIMQAVELVRTSENGIIIGREKKAVERKSENTDVAFGNRETRTGARQSL